MLRWSNLRRVVRVAQLPQRCAYSTASTSPENDEHVEDLKNTDAKKTLQLDDPSSETHSKLVAAAFASLQGIKRKSKAPSSVDAELDATEGVDALLSFADQPRISRRHAFKVWFSCLAIRWSDRNIHGSFVCRSSACCRAGFEITNAR